MEQQGGPPQPAQPPPPTDAATSRLDGLRAWLGTLDRMVEIRSLIGIVLAALAVGASAAAIYIALDSANSNDAELSRLQTEIDELRRDAATRDRTSVPPPRGSTRLSRPRRPPTPRQTGSEQRSAG
jgi:hypothetical protein